MTEPSDSQLQKNPPVRVSRLAPSPTGALHLGNARTFLINWALARQNRWRIVLRIEDLDGPRIKPGAAEQVIEDLRWLGLDWDEGPRTQRADLTPYRAALAQLQQAHLAYPCTCSRREIESAQSAPHAGEHELRYPGTCRPSQAGAISPLPAECDVAWRLRVPEESLEFVDQLHGRVRVNVQETVGDFVIATKAGLPAYQLAVVVDDARQGVTDIVRGDDLLSSAARQLWLYRLLDLTPLPRYWHLPLVLGSDGRRLAKRHGDTRIAWYREQGVPVERIVGLLAYWGGITPQRMPMTPGEFRERFAMEKLSRQPVVFASADHDWLLEKSSV